ncbi:MAG: LolA family protein [Chthonomonadales bacterium]
MKPALCIAILVLPRVSAYAQQNAAILVKQVDAAYRNLKACSYTATATIYIRQGGRTASIGSTATVRVQKPNRLYISVTTPQNGTLTFASDGRTATAYNTRFNQYVSIPAGRSIGETIQLLNRADVELFNHAIAAAPYDALYFLEEHGGAPSMAWKAAGNARVGSVACMVVSGIPTVQSDVKKVSLWIEPASHLLRKAQVVLAGTAAGSKGKVSGQATLVEEYVKLRANPSLTDADFRAAIPGNAVKRQYPAPKGT